MARGTGIWFSGKLMPGCRVESTEGSSLSPEKSSSRCPASGLHCVTLGHCRSDPSPIDPPTDCLPGLLSHLSLISYRDCPLTSGEDADPGDPENPAAARALRLGSVFPQPLSYHPREYGCTGCHPCLLAHSPAKGLATTVQPPEAVGGSGGEQGRICPIMRSSSRR